MVQRESLSLSFVTKPFFVYELAISDGAWLCRPLLYSQSFLNLTKPKVSTLTRERQVRWVRSGR